MSSLETTTPETTETPTQHESPEAVSHAGHDHDHDHDHEHHHHHAAPTLNPECTREIQVEVPADEVTKSFRTVVKRYQKLARIPGFRAGKVPETLVRSRFADQIRQEVVESAVPGQFRAALEKQNVVPVSQPQVTDLNLEEGKPLTFKAVFEILPEFSIDGYQSVTVEKPSSDLTDEEFNTELERIRDSRSTMEPVAEERALADGDWAQISFKGSVANEGEEAKPIEGEDSMVEVGGANTLPAFNEALRGAKVGQELKFEADYPADFGEKRLAGQTVSYDVEVKGIKKKIQPELSDEFAKELGEYEGIEDFKQKFREHLANDKKRRVEVDTREKLLEALVGKYQFPVPESLVQSQIDARLDRGLRALASQGMRAEDMRKLDFERLRAAQRDSAVAEVKGGILLDKISEAENVQVPDEELDRELEILSLQTREPLDSLRDRLTREGNLAKIRAQLRREKTGNLLVERLA